MYGCFQSPGYICKEEHIKFQSIDDDGTVCHCYENLCNQEVPAFNSTTTPITTTMESTSSIPSTPKISIVSSANNKIFA